MRITFKKGKKETGLRSVAHPYPATEIKGDGKVFGLIVPPDIVGGESAWTILFAVEGAAKKNLNCPWRWVKVKKTFDSEPEARIGCTDILPEFTKKYVPHFFDN